MARPKSTENEQSALNRIEAAFWDMMKEMPYSSITIRGLAERAGVNHNTLYYHFTNIDLMAKTFFENNLATDMPQKMLEIFFGKTTVSRKLLEDGEIILRWKHIKLFAGSGSVYLNEVFKSSIRNAWLTILNIDENKLTMEDKQDLQFILSGIIAIIGSKDVKTPEQMSGMLTRELGKGITATLQRITWAV